MFPARISALLGALPQRGSHPSPTQLDQISTYLDLLQRWNARINLTAIRKEEGIIPRHFGESFFLARHLFPNAKSGNLPSPQQMEPHDRIDRKATSQPTPASKLEARSS